MLRDLNGTWTTGCRVDGASCGIAVATINNSEVSSVLTDYADTTCTGISMVETITARLEQGSAVTVDGSVAGITLATQLDSTRTSEPGAGEVEYDLIAIQDDILYLGDN